ncbi:hypothetical protein H0A66_03710 [Alcaligenaceae bacterium]|nr:hypothetical protein [Alcaligenaceae bacterium]
MIDLKVVSLYKAALAKDSPRDTTSSDAISPNGTVEVKPAVNIHVDLSGTGRSLSASKLPRAKNDDIDDSGLPEAVKQALKLIREIKAQLQEKLQELQAVKNNPRLTTEQRKARAMAVQSEINILSAALTAATGRLLQLIDNIPMSDDQKMTTSMLSMT